MSLSPSSHPSPSSPPPPPPTFLSTIYIKIKPPNSHSNPTFTSTHSQTKQPIFTISTYSIDNDQCVQNVYRTFVQLENFSRYIVGQYGGYIVPVLGNLGKGGFGGVGGVLGVIQEYLEDCKNNYYCGTDPKLYCFLLEQPMMLPHVQTYTKVLSKASNISKKYLNAIFTRKQLPQQKDTQTLVQTYQKILESYTQFLSLRQIVQTYITEQRSTEQLLTIFAELSGHPNCSPLPQEDIMIEAEKLIRVVEKYVWQTREAYQRWEILVERVRELRNNLCKGLHEDQEKFYLNSKQLKNWTTSLGNQMVSMRECIAQFIDYICGVVNKMKSQTLWAIESTHTASLQNELTILPKNNTETKQEIVPQIAQEPHVQIQQKYIPSTQTTLDEFPQKP